jgi:succinate-semialdehyde dehydrogenase/glutarate-semialdehyde dehydrogenase/succinyl-CoA reductase
MGSDITMKFATTNPSTGELLAEYEMATPDQVEAAVHRARQAFQDWRRLRPSERGKFLAKVADALKARKDEFARIMTNEMGKIIRESTAEVAKCALALDYYAENAERFLTPELAQTDASKSFVAFEPLGVIAAIMPWNFPMWQLARFAAPALAAGNTTVFKPASATPQTGLSLEAAFNQAGLPAGCFKTLLGDSRIADLMIDSDADAVTFTGSVSVGSKVGERSGRNLKKFVLELGGSDPFIVLEDADLETASAGAVTGRFINCGQSCIAAKRFIVAKPIAEKFTEEFVGKVKKMKVGDPLDPETDMGPLVNESGLKEIERQVKDSVKMGAQVLTGGHRLDRKGFFFAPTLLSNVTQDMPVMREEVFGPVAPIMAVRDQDEAVRVANATEFGLGASVWTRNLEEAEKIARQIQSGVVTVNNVVASDPRVPFGGVKKSGIGRELGRYGLLEFTNIKTVRLYERRTEKVALTE